ncbi:MAG: hypothetical protein NVS3B3_17190 [Aquirhabdus sp.]
MKHLQKLAAVLVLSSAAISSAYADSDFQTGAGALTATTHLDFQIIIPKFISFQLGSAAATVDMVTFTVPAANVGNGTAVAGVNSGSNPVPVTIKSNNGNVSLVGTTIGALKDAAGDTISFSQINSTSAAPAALPAPTLVDGAASAAVTVPATSKVVNTSTTWTFAYANSAIVPTGTYGGANLNNGRVTYTASLP